MFLWKQKTPLQAERPLSSDERLMNHLNIPLQSTNREYLAVNLVLDVQFDNDNLFDTTLALKNAWIMTRYHHPLIAAKLDPRRDVLSYVTPNEQELAFWLDETVCIHEDGDAATFLTGAHRQEYSSVHYFSQGKQLLLRSHHWLVDGLGIVHLADRFLKFLAAGPNSEAPVRFGDEFTRLNPALPDAAGMPVDPTGDEELVQRELMAFVKNLPSAGVPIRDDAHGVPGDTLRERVDFSSEFLQELLEASKRKGTSLASAVYAAVVMATFQLDPIHTPRFVTSPVQFDYRKYLSPPYDDTELWPIGLYTVNLFLSVPEGPFEEMALACQKFFKQPLDRDDFPVFGAYEQTRAKVIQAITAPPPPGTPPPRMPIFSSVGRLDDHLQHHYPGKYSTTVKAVEPRVDVSYPSPIVYQWSFRGEFSISVLYNKEWNSKDVIEQFVERITAALISGMGIKTRDGGKVLK